MSRAQGQSSQEQGSQGVRTVLLLVLGMFLLVSGATLVARQTAVGVLLLLAGQVIFLVNLVLLLRRRHDGRQPGRD